MPNAADLFADADSPKKAAKSMDTYLDSLNKAMANPSTVPGQAPVDPVSQLEALAANKSLSPDAIGALQGALAAQRSINADIVKEITLTSPLSTSFAQFDLEVPAKNIAPRPTPLRNKIVRKKGMGTAHRTKRIVGYTGTGTGGQGNIFPGIAEQTVNTFNPSLSLNRGPQISYTADDIVLPYNSYGLSDQVSWDANYSGLGFQDLRQLSSTSTLYATMLMEERMMLMARGTATGYSGALAAPTVTLSARTAAAGEVAMAATTYYVYATSDAGAFGESVLSTVASQAVSSGQVLVVTVNNVVGALGTKVYIGTTTGAANCHYIGRISGLVGVVQGAASTTTTGDNLVYSTTGTLASTITADTSAYATGYDGILPTVLGPNSGFVNEINGLFSTANPGNEFQKVFSGLYDAVKADPDEILLNGSDRKQLSDAIKNGSTANYRLNLAQTDMGDYVGGAVIGALHNEVTGKLVNLTVHPWLPQGVAPVLSYTLPVPDSNISEVWANIMVQDYIGTQWPVIQNTFDFSVYFRGTFFCHAPSFNGVVSGIVSA
jgi:hypothetical protein